MKYTDDEMVEAMIEDGKEHLLTNKQRLLAIYKLKKAAHIPQPSDIEVVMKEKFENKKIKDDHGWVGEWSLSVKNVLDIIIDTRT